MQCALYPFWRVPNWLNVSFMNFNTAKAHFWLLVSQYFRKYFRNYFQTYFRNYFRNYFQKSFQIYSLFFECQLRRARQASCAFPFLAGAWRIQRSFFFLVLIQRNTFWLPIRFLFMFLGLFPELSPKLFPEWFPKLFPKLFPNLFPKLLANLFPKFCQHYLFFFHEFY